MRVFLDVGAHVGETLLPAMDLRYRFDKIVCFEPVQACCAVLERLVDDRVEICHFGLGMESGQQRIHDPGTLGASVHAEGPSEGRIETVEIRRASDWFKDEVAEDDDVFLKLNCEGSECDILDDLLRSGEIRKVDSALVDFDVRKVSALAHRETEVTELLEAAGYSQLLRLKEQHRGPTHTATIDDWLRSVDASTMPPPTRWKWRFVWLPAATRRVIAVGKGVSKRILPKRVYENLRRLVQKNVYDYPPDADGHHEG